MLAARVTLGGMKRSLVQIIADNAQTAFQASGIKSYRALAGRAGLSPNTVKNLLQPEQRAPNARGDTSPRMDVLEKLAHALGYEAWQLMQGHFQPADPPVRVLSSREAAFYRRIEEAYKGLDRVDPDEPPKLS